MVKEILWFYLKVAINKNSKNKPKTPTFKYLNNIACFMEINRTILISIYVAIGLYILYKLFKKNPNKKIPRSGIKKNLPFTGPNKAQTLIKPSEKRALESLESESSSWAEFIYSKLNFQLIQYPE